MSETLMIVISSLALCATVAVFLFVDDYRRLKRRYYELRNYKICNEHPDVVIPSDKAEGNWYVVEQLSGLGRVDSKRMFGGVGLYCDGLFFGLLSNDTLCESRCFRPWPLRKSWDEPVPAVSPQAAF